VAQDEACAFRGFEHRPAPHPATARLAFADDGAKQPPTGLIHARQLAGGHGHVWGLSFSDAAGCTVSRRVREQ
jgi:hypothetical protein